MILHFFYYITTKTFTSCFEQHNIVYKYPFFTKLYRGNVLIRLLQNFWSVRGCSITKTFFYVVWVLFTFFILKTMFTRLYSSHMIYSVLFLMLFLSLVGCFRRLEAQVQIQKRIIDVFQDEQIASGCSGSSMCPACKWNERFTAALVRFHALAVISQPSDIQVSWARKTRIYSRWSRYKQCSSRLFICVFTW